MLLAEISFKFVSTKGVSNGRFSSCQIFQGGIYFSNLDHSVIDYFKDFIHENTYSSVSSYVCYLNECKHYNYLLLYILD